MRTHLVGEDAVLVELEGEAPPYRVADAIRSRSGVVESVPAATTVLVVVDPLVTDAADLAGQAAALVARAGEAGDRSPPGAMVEIPVHYDGPDLDEVCRLTGLDRAEVVARHSRSVHRVAFLGFSPGFAYLAGTDPALSVPRRQTPRPSVPAGSVGLAGGMSCLYPRSTPGGWQLIGTTSALLFDQRRRPPALLSAGDSVRLVPVDSPAPPEVPVPAAPPQEGRRSLEVLRAGPLTTVQDRGRPGWAHIGVPPAGAVDQPALALANRMVGNRADAACLETTLSGPELRFGCRAVVAVAGATAPVSLDGRPVHATGPLPVRPGSVLRVGTATAGLRCYIAFDGGIDAPVVLGSRSADTLSGLGPPALAPGDVVVLADRPPGPGGDRGAPTQAAPAPATSPDRPAVVRVVSGPRHDWLTPAARAALTTATWVVSPRSDRTGVRLEGPVLERSRSDELASEGMVTGAVQVPPDGAPIVFLANHPTTGGYPVVGVVASVDLGVMAQLRPGAPVRFEVVDRAAALAARRR
ncbi:MAG TPA: 5-oxoprolinase subunit PxpB [Acidimicrobiales bacterium]|nr:5-oxoprolinase subunit PxpB [Acidimicrobiales bacterium]